MIVYNIERGPMAKPVKACVYGPEGVGKTTFAAAWPGAVFIDIEDGSGTYDVARMPRPGSWLELLDEVAAARTMPEVTTLVIDTADAAERLCVAHVCGKYNWDSIESPGYGKGHTALGEEFAKLLDALDRAVESGKHVLIVAHAQIRKFEQPDELGAYDRWELKLHKKVAPLVKEWADLLLFANFKADVMRDEVTKKAKAIGGKRRLMYASHTAAYDAKNRLGLPDEMPFEFAAIADKVPVRPSDARKAPDVVKPDPEPEPAPRTPHDELTDLMAASKVTASQLMQAVGSRPNNPYSSSTPIVRYSPEFVRDVLIAHWDAILATIGEQLDIPFN